MTVRRLVALLNARTELPFSQRDVERVLAALLSSSDIWAVVEKSAVPMRVLCELLNVLRDEELLTVRGSSLSLTDAGRALCEQEGVKALTAFLCPSCDGRGVSLEQLKDVSEKFARIARKRPEAVQQFDQGYVTEETTLARIAFAWQRGDLEGKEIIVLGDDDLVSIAAALTGAPKRVLMLDIDERLVKLANEVKDEFRLDSLEAAVHDLREPMPKEWVGAFDTFLTDPTESLVGFKAFVERGLLCLKGVGSAGYFGLTHVESSLSKWQKVQRFLLDSGAVITDLIDFFNHYVNWGYIETMRSWAWLPVKVKPQGIWYKSALYRIEVLENKQIANRKFEGNIFEDEEAATT